MNDQARFEQADILESESSSDIVQENLGHSWYIVTEQGRSGPMSLDVLKALAIHDPGLKEVWHPVWNRWLGVQEFRQLTTPDVAPTALPERLEISHGVRFPSDVVPLVVLTFAFLGFIFWFSNYLTLEQDPEKTDLVERHETRLLTQALGMYQEAAPSYSIKVCNMTQEENIYISLAYFDRQSKSWRVRGWVPTSRQECSVALKDVKPPVYVYGETSNRRRQWRGKEGQNVFCTHERKSFHVSLNDCERSMDEGMRWQAFVPLDLRKSNGGMHTWVVRD